MGEMEKADPSRKRGLLEVVAGRANTFPAIRREVQEAKPAPSQPVVSFSRNELRIIFDVYGAKVAAGEWRDYAIDFTPAKAVFSVFRRTSEAPIYRIEKRPELSRRQGAYSVISVSGLVMRRGHDLGRVVAALDRKLKLVGAEPGI
jgi:hypothetical protein